MNAHRFFAFVGLCLLLVAARTYANGAYQKTEDRKKTLVWNNDPKPGDGATWTGQHDDEGYATGPGTLTWYQVDRGFTTGSNIAVARKKTPISSYSGTMEHGKFNGTVTTVDHGKTFHANFADGQRKGRWMSGPAGAKAETEEAATTVKKVEKSEPPAATSVATQAAPGRTEKAIEEKKAASTATETEPPAPAAGPVEDKVGSQTAAASAQGSDAPEEVSEPTSKQTSETTQKTSEPLIAQNSSSDLEQSATPREPVTRKAALAPGAVRAIERPTGAPAKKSEPTRTKPEKTEKPTKTAAPAPSQPAEVEAESTEQTPAEGPDSAEAEKARAPSSKPQNPDPSRVSTPDSKPSANETPVDDSIRALVGPPSSLRSAPTRPETNPPVEVPAPAAAAPSAPTGPKLTAVEAMDIADIEARTRGYDLGEYQLPRAEYNATSESWSVSYAGRDSEKSKKLSVIVQDKNGKAEVKR